jgi:hypothetical protein
MAKNLIDVSQMHQIGASSLVKPASNKSGAGRALLSKIGNLIYQRIQGSYARLNSIRDNVAAYNEEATSSMADFSADTSFGKQGRELIKKWQGEYDKGAKQLAFGFGKKKQKGRELMASSMQKIGTLQKYLLEIDKKKKENAKLGLKALGKGHLFEYDDGMGFNEGMTTQEFELSAMSADGSITNYLDIDENTGRISMKVKEGPLDFYDLKFAPKSDKTVGTFVTNGNIKAAERGARGVNYDENYGQLRMTQVQDFVDGASEHALRSWFFGRRSIGGEGEITPGSPAHNMLVAAGEKPKTEAWTAQMELLKNQDFGPGGSIRNTLPQDVLKSEKYYQEKAYQEYVASKEEESTNKTVTPEVGNFAHINKGGYIPLAGVSVQKGSLENIRTAIASRRPGGFYLGPKGDEKAFVPVGRGNWEMRDSDGKVLVTYKSVSELIKSGLKTSDKGFTSLITMDIDGDGIPDGVSRFGKSSSFNFGKLNLNRL